MSYGKPLTDKGNANVWDIIHELSKQPASVDLISRNLTDVDREFVASVVVENEKRYDRVRNELVGVIERLSGEKFR